jgi:hypothetical protein
MEERMRYDAVLLLFTILLLCSCGVTDAPFEHKYVINVILKPEMQVQRAYVDSTYRLDEPVNENVTGISGANVFIVSESPDTFHYNEVDSIMGEYHSDDTLWVAYGMKYTVNVAIGNDTISQEVTVPDSLRIHHPSDFDTVSLSSPPLLVWNTCAGCYNNSYTIYAYITGQADSIRYPMATPDTVLGIFYALDLFPDLNTLYTIAVLGMDEHCYNAGRGWLNYDEIEDERALGVIGACVMDTVVVFVRE